jgi:phenylacetate-CoA ligase
MASATRLYNPIAEQLSREELEALQLRKLQRFVDFAYHRSDFYRRKFDAAGVEPEQIRTLDDFRKRIPLTTKTEWLEDQANRPPYGSASTVQAADLARFYLTSGTSGIGQEVHALTRADLEYAGSWTYGFHWAGIDPGDVFVNTLPVGLGNLAGPDSGIQSAVRSRLNIFNIGHLPAEQKLAMMCRFSPDLLFAVPAYLQRLELLAREQGIDPRTFGLKAILLAAEPYTIEWAERAMEFWGCPLTELYGSTQATSAIAFPCEHGAVRDGRRGILHVLEHLIFAEVVGRATREQVEPGEDGELVLTSFERVGTPLLRWASDDRVQFRPHSDCSCGRPFSGMTAGEVARYDDMMKIKAVNVWPEAVDGVMFRDTDVAEYQGEVFDTDAGTTVAVRVEFRADIAPERRAARLAELSRELRETIGIGMNLVEAAEPLPRFEFKVRRWTDHRVAGRQRILHTEKA